MDPESRAAATAVTGRWLHNNPKWNFGRFNTDVDLEIYPLFDLQFPLPDDWDSEATTQIKDSLKEYKKGLWKHVLTEMKKDPSLAGKAAEALTVSYPRLYCTYRCSSLRGSISSLCWDFPISALALCSIYCWAHQSDVVLVRSNLTITLGFLRRPMCTPAGLS